MLRTVLGFLLFFYVASALATQNHWFVGGGAGAIFPKTGDNNYISSGPGWPNDKYSNGSVNTAALFSVDAGYQWAHANDWLPFYSVAANYIYAFPAKAKGTVDQYSLPQFQNYNYQYKVQSQQFLAVLKADLYRWCQLMPFLSVGAGFSLNNASNYAEQAVPGVTPRVSPGFKGQTNTYFSYMLGAGLDYIVLNNLWISLQYQYSDQGYAQTGAGSKTPMLTDINYDTDHLKNKLTASAVLLNVTYFFDPVA